MEQSDSTQHPLTRRSMLLSLLAGAATACSSKLAHAEEPAQSPLELAVCGADEVFILASGANGDIAPRKTWSWRAKECAEIPKPLQRKFQTTDDCKPVDGGRKILISSSSGAIALIDRQTRRALFHAEVVNAHSVEMLPGGRIAAAASSSTSPLGNRVILFDLATGKELAADALAAAHGVVWDAKRELLWALGHDHLRAYRLTEKTGGTCDLKMEFQAKLPAASGHDLTPASTESQLFLSTANRCWHFDRDTRKFSEHNVLGKAAAVKSYSIHPPTGRIAYIQAEGDDWWAERIHFLNPDGVLHLPKERLYKARWL